MEDTIMQKLSRAWNAFRNKDRLLQVVANERGASSSSRPDRTRLSFGNERSIIASIFTRLSVDVASVNVQHIRVDDEGRYLETIKSGLNDCLTLSANIDQTGAGFLQDAALSLFDEGAIAIVPVDTTADPTISGAYDVNSMRVGKIREWFPSSVRVDVYNDRTGRHEEITLPKQMVAIVENPFYSVMNEANSTLKRLILKLNLLDSIDKSSNSGKLDIIIQLPYLLKSEAKKERADARRKEIEDQLTGSTYGIAYTDGTEKVIQLNRPTENNLMAQIEYLTSMLYSQLGLTASIMDGTADEKTMINYQARTIDPIVTAIVDSMSRTFITKTARTQGQRIFAFTDAFKLVPMSVLSEMVDKFTRNEVISSNEVRSIIGMKPSKDPKADELRNKNINNATTPEIEKGGGNVDE